ncbi:hypothetical protein D1814_16390 [Alteromonas sp. BL110]|nr:hypothetical protein D1814_16390 [Alteromonas sp. BL110]RKM79378.1 hypothetical protein D7031_10385 [Alteromonas sp. BL110]
MPLKKWTLQYLIAFPLLLAIFASVQYLKGQSILYSLEFGVTWAFISIFIFAVRRAYNFKRRNHCDICIDLPFHSKIN